MVSRKTKFPPSTSPVAVLMHVVPLGSEQSIPSAPTISESQGAGLMDNVVVRNV